MVEPLITRGFRGVQICNLTDPTDGAIDIEQVTEISHDRSSEVEDRTYEDNVDPSRIIQKKKGGSITMKGDLQKYIHSKWAAGSKTEARLFEENNFYLIMFLSNDADGLTSEMIYNRWVGQLIELPKQSYKAGELNEQEIMFRIVQMGPTRYAADIPYKATADPDPGPTDATPAVDYDPVFSARAGNATKTLAAAETAVGAGIVNPFTRA